MHNRASIIVLAVIALITLNTGIAAAVNLRVTNAKIAAGAPAGQANVQFHICWDLSWRGPRWKSNKVANWDAAWIFVKYRPKGAEGWRHATLSAKAGDHTVPAGHCRIVPADAATRPNGAALGPSCRNGAASCWAFRIPREAFDLHGRAVDNPGKPGTVPDLSERPARGLHFPLSMAIALLC